MLETSGELFMISLTLDIGREIGFLLPDAWSSLPELLCDIFIRTGRETSGTSKYCFEL